jgi:hypothetical protein
VDTVCAYFPDIREFGQMLQGEFHDFFLLSHTTRQLSVLRSSCTIPHQSILHILSMTKD